MGWRGWGEFRPGWGQGFGDSLDRELHMIERILGRGETGGHVGWWGRGPLLLRGWVEMAWELLGRGQGTVRHKALLFKKKEKTIFEC